jgi:hypothetical protein
MPPEMDLPAALFPSAGPDWAIFTITWVVRIGALTSLLVILGDLVIGRLRRTEGGPEPRPAK